MTVGDLKQELANCDDHLEVLICAQWMCPQLYGRDEKRQVTTPTFYTETSIAQVLRETPGKKRVVKLCSKIIT